MYAQRLDLGFKWLDDASRLSFLLAVMGAAATLLGLVLAATTFTVDLVQGERFTFLVKSQGWRQFPELIRSCVWRMMLLTVVSGAMVFLSDYAFRMIAFVLVFLIVWTIQSLVGILWVLLNLLAIPPRN